MLSQYFKIYFDKNKRALLTSLIMVFIGTILLNYAPLPDDGKGFLFFLSVTLLVLLRPKVRIYKSNWEYFLSLPLNLQDRMIIGISDYIIGTVSLFIFALINYRFINFIFDLNIQLTFLGFLKAIYLYLLFAPLVASRTRAFPPNEDMRKKRKAIHQFGLTFAYIAIFLLIMDLVTTPGMGLFFLINHLLTNFDIEIKKVFTYILNHWKFIGVLLLTVVDLSFFLIDSHEKGINEHHRLRNKIIPTIVRFKRYGKYLAILLVINLISFASSLPFKDSKDHKHLKRFHDGHFKFYASRTILGILRDTFIPDTTSPFYMISNGQIDKLKSLNQEQIREMENYLSVGKLPVEYAIYENQLDIAYYLIKAGWALETTKGVETFSIDDETNVKSNVFRRLARHGEARHIEEIMKRNIDVNRTDMNKYKTSMLTWAAGECNNQTVERILPHFKDINYHPKKGNTAIYHAVREFKNSSKFRGDCILTIQMLLKAGANPSILNTNGKNVFSLVEKMSGKKKYGMEFIMKSYQN